MLPEGNIWAYRIRNKRVEKNYLMRRFIISMPSDIIVVINSWMLRWTE
jgi:hypothetical protein